MKKYDGEVLPLAERKKAKEKAQEVVSSLLEELQDMGNTETIDCLNNIKDAVNDLLAVNNDILSSIAADKSKEITAGLKDVMRSIEAVAGLIKIATIKDKDPSHESDRKEMIFALQDIRNSVKMLCEMPKMEEPEEGKEPMPVKWRFKPVRDSAGNLQSVDAEVVEFSEV